MEISTIFNSIGLNFGNFCALGNFFLGITGGIVISEIAFRVLRNAQMLPPYQYADKLSKIAGCALWVTALCFLSNLTQLNPIHVDSIYYKMAATVFFASIYFFLRTMVEYWTAPIVAAASQPPATNSLS